MTIVVLLALLLSVVALMRAASADRRADELMRRTEWLRRELHRLQDALPQPDALRPPPPEVEQLPVQPPVATPSPAPLPAASVPEANVSTPVQAEVQAASPFTPRSGPPVVKPSGPSLWGPEFSRARISVIGGLLVLGGLAFTLHSLGAPAWTLLLAVFGFGGLLYFNAQRVPWPVSGALRGLGYGVSALGLGSLAQRLPPQWGPGVVLLGLLALSAALLWDGLRRREPLLGALAVFGAAQSTWMLTDDLGAASIVAAGAVMLLAAAAVWWGRVPGLPQPTDVPEVERERLAAQRAALPLTLAVAGAVPVGWLVAAISHLDFAAFGQFSAWFRTLLHTSGGTGGLALLPWLGFSVMALSVPLALLSRPRDPQDDKAGDAVTLASAWATLAPQALAIMAVGSAVTGRSTPALTLLLAGILLLGLIGAARFTWVTARTKAGPQVVPGSLTASAAALAGTLALGLLGERTAPVALSGIALTLLMIGLMGRNRLWLAVGVLGSVLVSIWAVLGTAEHLSLDVLLNTQAFKGLWQSALPAVLGLLAAARVGRDAWANEPPAALTVEPPTSFIAAISMNSASVDSRWLAPLLAAVSSALLSLALATGGAGLLWCWVLVAAAGLLALRRHVWPSHVWPSPWMPERLATPGLMLGALLLLPGKTHSFPLILLGVTAALLAAAALYLSSLDERAGRSGAVSSTWASTSQVLALTFLALALSRAALAWWPALGIPGALALTALLSVPLRLKVGWQRMDVLLGLGAVLLLSAAMYAVAFADRAQVPVLGGFLLLLVWGLTRTPGGLRFLGRMLRTDSDAAHPPVLRSVWLAALLLLALTAVGARLSASGAALSAWLILGSLAVLVVGIRACVTAHRAAEDGELRHVRALWDTGMALIACAGLKGALLDALTLSNTAAGLGLAVLVTGLSLLAVAVLAPRPAANPDAATSATADPLSNQPPAPPPNTQPGNQDW